MKKLFTIFLILISAAIIGCGNKPLFDYLDEKKINVVIKGTYESNSPRDWFTGTSAVVNDDSMTVCPPDGGVASATKPATYDSFPTIFKMDIAEMKLNNDRFANHRTLYSNAIDNNAPLFNGTGVPYNNDDVKPGKVYGYLNVYFRKVIFTNAYAFNAESGSLISTLQSYFDEVKSDGLDFNPLQSNSKFDTLLDNYASINRTFPLSVPVTGGFVFDNQHEYVLELRVVIKNFVKRYEKILTPNDSDVINSYHFFAFSDLLNDVRAGDPVIGGNMVAGARWYIKGQTATISGTVGVAPSSRFVIAIPAGDDIAKYNNPLTSRPADYYSPRIPSAGGTDVVSMLEYYVDKQKYNFDYANYVTLAKNNLTGDGSVTDFSYVTTWVKLNTATSSYRIPPLATYVVASGTYELDNVQAGLTYDIYWADGSTVGMGALPTNFTFGRSIVVPMSSAGTIITGQNL
jgi:hypothetical protein